MRSNVSKLTLMVGIPGSGKSTYASKIMSEYDITLSLDTIRESIYGDANQQGQQEIDLFFSLLKEAVKHNKSILIDNTNLVHERRLKIIMLCPGYDVDIIVMQTPYSVCVKRNKERTRQVPDHVIGSMLKTQGDLRNDPRFHLISGEVSKVTYISHLSKDLIP